MHNIYRLLHKRIYSTVCLWLFLTLPALAQMSISTVGTAVSQTFNALPATGTGTFIQNTALPGVYAERTGTGTIIAASDGSTATGGLYSFGTGNNADRALGAVPFNNVAFGSFAHGIRLKNNTTSTIRSLQVSYMGEQWVNGGATPQTIAFSYLVSTTPIVSLSASVALPTGYSAVSALDFTGPIASVATGALNGNADANRATKTATITSLSIAPGSEIMLRWYNAYQTSTNQGLAIDDVSITASATVPSVSPTLAVTPANISNLTTTIGVSSSAVSYTLTGRNLTDPVTVSATTGIEISTDPTSSTYTSTISITPTTGSVDAIVSVRLTGAVAGPVSATITNANSTTAGPLTGRIIVSGTVLSPNAAFATIAVARSQPDGTLTSSLPGGKIAGRVTVSSQFGGKLFYIQDYTGGISVFNNTTAVGSSVQLGDSVQVAGTINTFQGAREIDFTSYTVVPGTPRIPTPKAIQVSQLPTYEGQLVSIRSTTIGGSGTTFTSTAYSLSSNSGTGTLFIKQPSELNGAAKPSGVVDIIGIVDHVSSGTVNTSQLFPRVIADLSTTVLADQICGGTGGSALTTDQTLDISTWSLNFFGATAGAIACTSPPLSRTYTNQGPVDEERQTRNVRTVLQKLNADIVVNEDVSDEVRYAAVVKSLPGSYSYVCSDKFSFYFQNQCDQPINSDGTVFGPTKFAQKVCFLYNTATVTPVLAESKALLASAYSFPASNGWESGRLPYLFVANVTINGLTRKIHVVGIHAKSGNATADYNRRWSDVDTLKAELDRNYPNANIVVIGNYNDQVNTSTTTGKPSSYSAFTADATNYQIVTRTLETTGCVTSNTSPNFLDHITISSELAPAYLGNSAAVLIPEIGIEGAYATTTSDHNPVSARFNIASLAGPPAPLAVTLTVSPVTSTGTASLSATVLGGTAPYSYTFSGPGIITLNGNTATVTSLTATGVQSFTVKVSDASNQTAIATTLKSGTGTTGGIAADTSNNLFAGKRAGFSNTTGYSNVGLGVSALYSNQTGRNNVAVGDSAGFQNTASSNTFLGAKAGFSNTTAIQGTFIGDSAGFYSNAVANTFVGYKTGLNTTTGRLNTFMGVQAGMNNTTGSSNFIMGTNAGVNNTTGSYNLFIGENAGGANTTGSSNIYMGENSGNTPGVNGNNNVSVGFESGKSNLAGETNTFLGFRADAGAANLSNATAIGANAKVTVSNAIILGSGANVGIGTTAPTAKLEVTTGIGGNSGIKITNLTSQSPASVNARKFLTVDATGLIVLANYSASGRVGADTTEALWQRNGRMLQSVGGDAVVIGSNVNKTPVGYKLFVEDGILTEKVKVAIKNTSDWSDYVFATGYRLKSLAEVEAYVKAHRHLPGIPSAEEVVKEGVDVGKMDAKLLEKVEETMLYLMQMNKRLEQLEKENRQLNIENKQIKRKLGKYVR